MSSAVGFQFALELSNAFPLKDLARYTATQVLDFARKLRVSGSDLVVEEDLAAVFGRGRISPDMEQKFKEVVKEPKMKINPIFPGSQVVLDSGPGPTVVRAFQDQHYLAALITLSMLAYFHNRENFATMVAACLTKRFEMAIPQTSPSPGYEGILNTLAACSSQTSAFAWSYYSQQVEERLCASIPTYEHSSDYIRISPPLMLGAMDYFYLLQSLPKDRKITVSNQSGCVTLTIWAHYLLGLTVVIRGQSFPPIIFGDKQDPHVFIFWASEVNSESTLEDSDESVIRLLQKDDVVLTESTPDLEQTLSVRAEERHPLAGWGLVYLRRLFNNSIITPDSSSMYEESVKLVMALAIHVSNRLDRDMNLDEDMSGDEIPERKIHLETWRVLDLSKVMFLGLKVNTAGVETYVKWLSDSVLDETSCPVTYINFLKNVKRDSSEISSTRNFLRQIKYLARIVLILSYVVDIEKCAEMPLLLANKIYELDESMTEVLSETNRRSKVRAMDIFEGVVKLLSSTVLDPHNTARHITARENRGYYLCSDFGWSVFLSCVAEKDPAEIRPELIHVHKGTPTNQRTQERRFRIADGHIVATPQASMVNPAERGAVYLPRATAMVTQRREFWSTHLQEFEMCLYLSVKPMPEWLSHGAEPYMATTSFHYMYYSF